LIDASQVYKQQGDLRAGHYGNALQQHPRGDTL
jgi:hypothetical protein